MRIALLLLLLPAALAFARVEGTTRVDPFGPKGPELVVVCSGERFPLRVEADAATATGSDPYQRWVSSPLRDVINQKDGRCTAGGAQVWTETSIVDVHAWCPPRCLEAVKKAATKRKARRR